MNSSEIFVFLVHTHNTFPCTYKKRFTENSIYLKAKHNKKVHENSV